MTFTEQRLVEDYFIEQLVRKGWQFVHADQLERDTFAEPLLLPNLIRALQRINFHLEIGEEETQKVMNELKLTSTGAEGAKRVLSFFKFGVPVKFESEKIVKYVQLFDFDQTSNNEFIISRQVHFEGRELIRTDIILFVNGIPLVNIECKNPASISESWYNAFKQIKEYENLIPELYKYIQIGVAAEAKAKYFPIVPWMEDVKIQEWREEGKDSIGSTIEMLHPSTLIDILQNYLFFRLEFGNATKVITRYTQYRAANKMVERVLKNLCGEEDKKRGLIWHWQGSGKTLTMIFAANKLYYSKMLEHPSIFFVVDRIELEEQLYQEFYALDMVAPEIIGSIDDLKKVLNHDDYRGKRGVFITLIHKFRPEELKQLQQELEAVSTTSESIMNRNNVITFIDEGHRTQYGLLAAQLKAILKNAFYFALTGTPLAKRGRDTYLEFSYPPEEPYLDKYFITDSIKDQFTVKIAYQPRLEDDVFLKKELLEGFLDTEFEELPEETRDIVEKGVKERLNTIKLFLEDPNRIKVIAEDIAEHFKENIDERFKAIVVAPSRKGCALYKDELDKHLPKEYSRVIMTYETRETDSVIRKHVAETRQIYAGKTMEEIRKDAIEKFKEEESPKILIVTDMLLTGFDAPILQVMYLDKPLKEHRLLQAVARTNRPYKELKEAGLIIDYVGILKEFKKALELYSESDVKNALYSYQDIRQEFISTLNDLLTIFSELEINYERDTLMQAIEILTSDEQNEKTFLEQYKNLRKIFELLGPDEIKLDHFEAYKWLSSIYSYYMKVVNKQPSYSTLITKYYEKTIRYVHKSIEVDQLEKDLPIINFDEEYLKNVGEKLKNKKEKAANILFTLNRLVLVEKHKNPIYESLLEKVERLLDLWKEKTKEYESIYKEGTKIIKEIEELSERQKSEGLTNLEYAMLLTLENRLGENDGLTNEVKNLSSKLSSTLFAGWFNQITIRKEVEREVRRFMRGIKSHYKISLDEMNQLHNKLIECVIHYGSS